MYDKIDKHKLVKLESNPFFDDDASYGHTKADNYKPSFEAIT